MNRSIIFLATSDRDFESTAFDAILETGHGVRPVRDFRSACKNLTLGSHDIALAIVDMTGKGQSLLRFLNAFEPDFPILIVTDDEDTLLKDRLLAEIAPNHLVKPVDLTTLQTKIQELCRGGKNDRVGQLP